MENVSKALLIAAAVLVVIILVAVGMKIYSSTTGAQKVATDTGKTINDKTNDITDIAISEITAKKNAINYGSKTKETIIPGDDITIGTEKFKVFSKTATEIKAMPYYNLVLSANPIKQATSETASLAGTSTFSSARYFFEVDSIDMSDSSNNIQQYVNAYKTTLEGLGAEEIEVRVTKRSELNAEGVTSAMRNPGQTSFFWLGSSRGYTANYGIWCINRDGNFDTNYYYYGCGVRPIIIIH